MAFLQRGGSIPIETRPVWSPVSAGWYCTLRNRVNRAPIIPNSQSRPSAADSRYASIRPAGLPAGGGLCRPADSPGAFHSRTSDAIVSLYESAKHGGPWRETRIPGYGGHIAGARDVGGRSQSRVSSRALLHGPQELLWRDSIPSDPQSKQSLARVQKAYTEEALGVDLSKTVVGKSMSGLGHIPGYTGFVPGIHNCALGESFGRVTLAAGHTAMNPKEARVCVGSAGEPTRWMR